MIPFAWPSLRWWCGWLCTHQVRHDEFDPDDTGTPWPPPEPKEPKK